MSRIYAVKSISGREQIVIRQMEQKKALLNLPVYSIFMLPDTPSFIFVEVADHDAKGNPGVFVVKDLLWDITNQFGIIERPVPLQEILAKLKPKVLEFVVNERVAVKAGPLKGQFGIVKSINKSKGTAAIVLFGTTVPTPFTIRLTELEHQTGRS
jgi:transcription antitermination factor NusG